MDCPKSNERYSKYGGFDKLNHRNANLLDNPIKLWKYNFKKNFMHYQLNLKFRLILKL